MGLSQADSEAFYYYTINAATANNIHHMTEVEIEQYKLRTCKYAANPSYTIINSNNTLSANLIGANYQWVDCNNGNTFVNGETNQSFTPTTNGNYAVQVTENSCINISNCIQINSLAVNDFQLNNLIKLYPNPINNNKVQLDCSLLNEEIRVYIKDMNGRLINTIVSQGNELITINTSSYSNGLYLLSIKTKDEQKILKILIQ